MPYTEKDMFVSSTRKPHGGLAQPLPMDVSQQAAVLDLLDARRRAPYRHHGDDRTGL